jgi:hypothetical protein
MKSKKDNDIDRVIKKLLTGTIIDNGMGFRMLTHYDLRNEKKDKKSNIRVIQSMPCSVCLAPAPSECHHYITRGAGGSNEMSNLVSLCHRHHHEFHNNGRKQWTTKYITQVQENRSIWSLCPLKIKND